jgi:probable addiction module antidote protein
VATKTILFDPAEHLTNPADQADLLNDTLDTGDAVYIANALGIIARARGMSEGGTRCRGYARGAVRGLQRQGRAEAVDAARSPRDTGPQAVGGACEGGQSGAQEGGLRR